jgi:hypothetical protein
MIKINKTLYNNIISYCKLNNIKNINLFIEELIKKQFYIECYGELVIDNDIVQPVIEDNEIINTDVIINNENVILNNDIEEDDVIENPIIKNNVIKKILK